MKAVSVRELRDTYRSYFRSGRREPAWHLGPIAWGSTDGLEGARKHYQRRSDFRTSSSTWRGRVPTTWRALLMLGGIVVCR